MDALVIDLTHGGIKIAISLSKKNIFENIYCFDIYNTLDKINREILEVFNIKITDLKDLSSIENDLIVISPVHLPLTQKEIKESINNSTINYQFINHHDAVAKILDNWSKRCENIPKVEITGVKGKTSCVFMLKEILKNPLILSSLGAILVNSEREMILKRNISITPANIKETIDLAYKTANPICEIAQGKTKKTDNVNYESAIFESSLGACGIGDVGLLTNIIEDYSIARGNSSAAIAKKQIFKLPIVVCEKETLEKYYSDENLEKINTFSLEDKKANLSLSKLNLGLNKTTLRIDYSDLITKENKKIDGTVEIETFAPYYHHVSNVLGVVGVALSLGIDKETIRKGLKKYNGIPGRSSIKKIRDSTIIEEINPGINATAIKKSIDMVRDLSNYTVIIGGDYGITCEEINEEEVCELIENETIEIILTEEVGLSILNKINKKIKYFSKYEDALDNQIENNENILLIYRSNYKKLNKR